MDLLAIALAPSIAIILFILYRDKFDREPPVVLLVSFVLGMLATLPALGLEKAAGYFEPEGIQGTILFAFLGVAVVEEGVKFIPLRLYSLTRKSFDEPLDGIVHGVMVGMGFATVENLLYVYNHGMDAGWLRMFTAVPGHASWGVIMGYYTGQAKFNFKRRGLLLFTGFLLATFFHGLYDACLFLAQNSDRNTASVLGLAAVTTHAVALIFASQLIKQHHHLSKGLHYHSPLLTIRHATESDVPLIRLLARKIWPKTYQKILHPKQIRYMMNLIYSEASLKEQMASGHQFIVVYNAAVPVGFASFSEIEPMVFKLQKIYLLPNQQGRGTGSFTIDQIIAEIVSRGATALRLNVNRHNKAKGFYERMGFAVIAEQKIDIGSGYVMDDYIMEKRLVDVENATNT
ncbi:MAG TPA: GNAT family N-acetyltransferase [Flavisolibacter sp.]|nr:GNAT family N-acetyltransferase [Flavisolibacter sp.]